MRLPFFATGPSRPKPSTPRPKLLAQQSQAGSVTFQVSRPRILGLQSQSGLVRSRTKLIAQQDQAGSVRGRTRIVGGQDQRGIVTGTVNTNLWPNGYKHQHEIRLKAWPGGGPVENFLLPFAEINPAFRSLANGGEVESAGKDIRFELQNGTQIPYMQLGWDAMTGRLACAVVFPWNMALPISIYLYIGKPGLADSEDDPVAAAAAGGWLFLTTGSAGTDFTGQSRDLNIAVTPPTPTLIGGMLAAQFDGVDDYRTQTDSTWLGGLSEISAVALYDIEFQNEARELFNVATPSATELSLRTKSTNRRLTFAAKYGDTVYTAESANNTAPGFGSVDPPDPPGPPGNYVIPPDLSFAGATTVTVGSRSALLSALNGQAANTSLVIILNSADYGDVTKDWGTTRSRRLKIVANTKVFTAYNCMTDVKTNYNPGEAFFSGQLFLRGFDDLLVEGLDFRSGGNSLKFDEINRGWAKHCEFEGVPTANGPTQFTIQDNLLAVIQECYFINIHRGNGARGPLSPDMDYAVNWYNGRDIYCAGSRFNGIYHQPFSLKEDRFHRAHLRFDFNFMDGRSPLAPAPDENNCVLLGQSSDSTTIDSTIVRAEIIRTRFRCGPKQGAIQVLNVATTTVDDCIFDGGQFVLELFRSTSGISGNGTAGVIGPVHPILTHMKNCTIIGSNNTIYLRTRGRGGSEQLRLENNNTPSLLTINADGSGLACLTRVGGNACGFAQSGLTVCP